MSSAPFSSLIVSSEKGMSAQSYVAAPVAVGTAPVDAASASTFDWPCAAVDNRHKKSANTTNELDAWTFRRFDITCFSGECSELLKETSQDLMGNNSMKFLSVLAH